MLTMKCPQCKEDKPLPAFIVRNRKRSGSCSDCRKKKRLLSHGHRVTWAVYRYSTILYYMVPILDKSGVMPPPPVDGCRFVQEWVTTDGINEEQRTPFGRVQDRFGWVRGGQVWVEVYMVPASVPPLRESLDAEAAADYN